VIHDVMPPSCQFLGVELDPVFVTNLRQRFAGLHSSKRARRSSTSTATCPQAKASTPSSAACPGPRFPEWLQIAILDHVLPRLVPGGSFVTFAYWGFHKLSQGRHFRELLQRQQGTLSITPVVCGQRATRICLCGAAGLAVFVGQSQV